MASSNCYCSCVGLNHKFGSIVGVLLECRCGRHQIVVELVVQNPKNFGFKSFFVKWSYLKNGVLVVFKTIGV